MQTDLHKGLFHSDSPIIIISIIKSSENEGIKNI